MAGKDNQGGLTQKVYFAPVDYFNVIQKFDVNPAVPGALVITTTHTFKAGKGFHTMYTSMDAAKLLMESTGERDGRGYNIKVQDVFHPGLKEEASAFARQCKNDQFIVLVESPNGEMLQIGTENLYAEIFAKFDSGTLSSGRNGYTFEIASFANGMIYYKGGVTLFPVAP